MVGGMIVISSLGMSAGFWARDPTAIQEETVGFRGRRPNPRKA